MLVIICISRVYVIDYVSGVCWCTSSDYVSVLCVRDSVCLVRMLTHLCPRDLQGRLKEVVSFFLGESRLECATMLIWRQIPDFVQAIIKGVWKSPSFFLSLWASQEAGELCLEYEVRLIWRETCQAFVLRCSSGLSRSRSNWTMSRSSAHFPAHFPFPVLTFAHIHTHTYICTHTDVMQMMHTLMRMTWHQCACVYMRQMTHTLMSMTCVPQSHLYDISVRLMRLCHTYEWHRCAYMNESFTSVPWSHSCHAQKYW